MEGVLWSISLKDGSALVKRKNVKTAEPVWGRGWVGVEETNK